MRSRRVAAVAENRQIDATAVMHPQVTTQPLLLPFTELTIMPAMPATHTTAAPPRNQLIGTPTCCQSSSQSGQPSAGDPFG